MYPPYLHRAWVLFCVGLADSSVFCSDAPLYGKAEFQPGMEEVEVPMLASSGAVPASTSVVVAAPGAGSDSAYLEDSEDGYSILQKGLFFSFIVGCVIVYMRLSSRRGRRFTEKSLA